MEKQGIKTSFCDSGITVLTGVILFIFNIGFIFKSCGGDWFHSLCSFMEFDRTLILKGEIWRLATCHIVHWSPEHLYLDSLVFIFQGITFEKKIGRHYCSMLFFSALSIGITLLVFRQGLLYYRGISGIINTQLVLGAGLFIFDRTLNKNTRGLFVACFLIHMIKIIYETIYKAPFFSTNLLGDTGLFTPVAHLGGVAVGFLFIFFMLRFSGKTGEAQAAA